MAANKNSDIALITGASAGIGRAFAEQLAPRCKAMILVGRDADKLATVAAELRPSGCDIHTLALDLTQPLAVAEVLEAIRQKGPVSILINNAGFATHSNLKHSDLDLEQKMVDLHCTATVALCRAALPYMTELGRGRIVNVASLAGLIPMKGAAVYGGSKAFLSAFSQCLAKEERSAGVVVQCLCPGYTHSDFHYREALGEFDKSTVPEEFWQTSEEVAAASLEKARPKSGAHRPFKRNLHNSCKPRTKEPPKDKPDNSIKNKE
ncbi:SDR family NAD(P)-dependent oxidoreductase [Spongiibacter sp.]|uniref:SDR family NAD(P)-dependent oxidoreductase n=1 Tax=Spongiibacter sp. TaxID=2024860 RepID=UPI000C4B80C0|nr:SDR family NAD(P)-dependent oxidoreductase [Spongiibacter sp.]MBU72496.1 short-chain dehydrogenase [Spongiibacter sp.]